MKLNPSIFIFALLIFIGGDWIYVNFFWHAPAIEYQKLLGQKVALYGNVVSDPEQKGKDQQFAVSLDGYKQRILALVRSRNDIKYGDSIVLIGKLKAAENEGDFDYADYLWTKGISCTSYYPEVYVLSSGRGDLLIWTGLQTKHWIYKQFDRIYGKDLAAPLLALVFGDKQFLSKGEVSAFNHIGAAHMIAVSGYKLTLLLVWLDALVPYLGRKKVFLISLILALFYAIAADFSAAVLRSAIMSVFYFGAKYYGKKNNLMRSLILTAAILVFLNPLIVKYDLGFILSFLGIVGIILFSPIIQAWLERLPFRISPAFGFKEVLISTSAAQLITLPVIIYYFHVLPLIAPVSNLLLVPLLGSILIFAYLSLLSALWLPLGWIFVFIEKTMIVYALSITESLNTLKYAWFPVSLGVVGISIIYLLELILYFLIQLNMHKSFGKITTQKYDK